MQRGGRSCERLSERSGDTVDRAQKEAVVADLNARFADAEILVVTQQSGMTVSESSDLRQQVRDAGASHQVAKNRLVKRALEGTKFAAVSDIMTGPTSLTMSADPVAAAKVCVEFSKKNEKLIIVGASLGEQTLDPDGVKALASLPSLDELRGKIVGLLQAPAGKIASVLQAPAGQVARVIAAYGAKDEAA